jgi:hypothetical protein
MEMKRHSALKCIGLALMWIYLFIYLFICSLFNDAVSIPDFTVLNDWLVGNNALETMSEEIVMA